MQTGLADFGEEVQLVNAPDFRLNRLTSLTAYEFIFTAVERCARLMPSSLLLTTGFIPPLVWLYGESEQICRYTS